METDLKNALISPSEVLCVYDADARHHEEAWVKRFSAGADIFISQAEVEHEDSVVGE